MNDSSEARKPSLNLPLLEKEALTIPDVIALGPVKRTRVYQAIAERDLPSHIVAGRRVVLRDDYLRWVRGGNNAA